MTKFEDIPKEVLYKALKRIHRVHGDTCPDFPECEHDSCNSSYNAWADADMVLHYEPGKNYPFDKEII